MELEEEARANWEERAIHQATQVTNLAGEAFETLSENRWSRRDCTEYQEELDYENLPKGLRRGRHREHACQDAQDGLCEA